MKNLETKGRVEGKVALVTGGADGIGAAIVNILAHEGARVIIADINEVMGKQEAERVGGIFMKLDVSSEESWKSVSAEIKKQFGGLNILVNNAGIMGKGVQDPEYATLESWQMIHKINLDSVFLGCKYGINLMKEQDGSIVNMSSRSGIVGVPSEAAYASTKAAIRNHSKSVALYCAQEGYNIRCNSVYPASILTAMWKDLLGTGENYDTNYKKFAKDIPMKRFGTAEEVAYAVLYLASDESSYTTGSELSVDGGILAGSATSPSKEAQK